MLYSCNYYPFFSTNGNISSLSTSCLYGCSGSFCPTTITDACSILAQGSLGQNYCYNISVKYTCKYYNSYFNFDKLASTTLCPNGCAGRNCPMSAFAACSQYLNVGQNYCNDDILKSVSAVVSFAWWFILLIVCCSLGGCGSVIGMIIYCCCIKKKTRATQVVQSRPTVNTVNGNARIGPVPHQFHHPNNRMDLNIDYGAHPPSFETNTYEVIQINNVGENIGNIPVNDGVYSGDNCNNDGRGNGDG